MTKKKDPPDITETPPPVTAKPNVYQDVPPIQVGEGGASATPEKAKQPVVSKPITRLPRDFDFKLPTKNDYEQARAKYIAEYTEYDPGGLFSLARYRNRPDVAMAKWNAQYPSGYASWAGGEVPELNGYGVRMMAQKINEIITVVNDLASTDRKPQ